MAIYNIHHQFDENLIYISAESPRSTPRLQILKDEP